MCNFDERSVFKFFWDTESLAGVKEDNKDDLWSTGLFNRNSGIFVSGNRPSCIWSSILRVWLGNNIYDNNQPERGQILEYIYLYLDCESVQNPRNKIQLENLVRHVVFRFKRSDGLCDCIVSG
jgi:hypothetical protein